MKLVLGKVTGEQMRLSEAGSVVTRVWRELPKHYNAIELDDFIVMPNHVHGIIWILGKPTSAESVGEGLRPSPTDANKPIGLPVIIRAFKSFSSREINILRNTKGHNFWQRGYHEHIIRNDDDLHQHRRYIRNNPLKWELDEYRQ